MVEQLREDIDSTPHMHGLESQLITVSVVWSREDIDSTHQGRPWVFLHVYRDMRKWDGNSTSTLHALQGKIITKGGSSRKVAAAVCSGQFLRQSGRADLTPDPMGRNSTPFSQEASG